ncbi:hypothetical protein [Glycomyces sp. YM15]|uniref:hypothetical protein n=1 Tax=Glycomyces sp. YM15 TaxID=2800446 RepID=UPI0019633B49|nr:hypothetical protein [Glycomyces sp. YM15]
MKPSDLVRALAVLLAAALQAAAGAFGGSGALVAEPVGDVARSYPNPLLPAGTAFLIWNLIYLAALALAVWQLLPSQRSATFHRRTGWWIAIAGILNTVWVLLFSADQIVASQIVITALLIALAAAWRNAALSAPSTQATRWLLWMPLTLYTGWVAVATTVGALTTIAAVAGDGVGTAIAVTALILTAIALAWVVARAVAVAACAAAAVWALAWIAVSADASEALVSAAAAILVASVLIVRLIRTDDRYRAAFG